MTAKSVRDGTFFENSKLPFDRILKLIAIWATLPRMNINEIRHMLGPNTNGQLMAVATIVDFYNFFREVCQVW